jgi:hypothetical protein
VQPPRIRGPAIEEDTLRTGIDRLRAGKAEHGEYGGDGRDEARAIFEHIGAQPWLDRLVALTV